MQVKFKKLDPRAIIPAYAKSGDSGFDLIAIQDVTILPGETELVHTGLAVELPEGYELQVRPRSGLSLKTPLLIKNSPGTVDNGYRGELGIICHCLLTPTTRNTHGDPGGMGYKRVRIKAGDRIAQGVLVRVEQHEIVEVEELSETERGDGGYGSTGK